MSDAATRRRNNFFRGTMRDPDAHPMTGIQDNSADIAHNMVVNPDTRRQLVDTHIGIVQQMLRSRNPPIILDQVTEERARAAALSINSTDPGTIASTVLAAATSSLPTDAQTALRNELQSRGISEGEYYAALGRFGASGSGDIAALMAAYRAAVARDAGGGYEARIRAEGYTGAAAGYLLNPGSVSMGNYMSTPYATTDMTHGTFSYLNNYRLPNNDRFTGLNILHSGQDAVTQRLGPNNRRAVTALATLDRYHPEGRAFRNERGPQLQDRIAEDAEMRRLRDAYRSATTPEEHARIRAQLHSRAQQISRDTGVAGHVSSLPPQAREAGRIWEEQHIERGLDRLLPNNPEARMHLGTLSRNAHRDAGTQQGEQARLAYEAELRRLAGNNPERRAEAEALIARQATDRVEAERAASVINNSGQQIVTARTVADDAWGALGTGTPTQSPTGTPTQSSTSAPTHSTTGAPRQAPTSTHAPTQSRATQAGPRT